MGWPVVGPLPALLLLVVRNKIKNKKVICLCRSTTRKQLFLFVCGSDYPFQNTKLLPPRADANTRARGPPLAAVGKISTSVRAPLELSAKESAACSSQN